MCTTPLRLLAPFLLFAVAACHTTEPAPPLPPMPMGEVAQPQPVHEDWADVTAADPIALDWVNSQGIRVRIAFKLVYRTRITQELLAAECVRNNWSIATERAQRVCEKADFLTQSGVDQCTRDLQQQLGEALFPCDSGEPLAMVSKIFWVRRLFD